MSTIITPKTRSDVTLVFRDDTRFLYVNNPKSPSLCVETSQELLANETYVFHVACKFLSLEKDSTTRIQCVKYNNIIAKALGVHQEGNKLEVCSPLKVESIKDKPHFTLNSGDHFVIDLWELLKTNSAIWNIVTSNERVSNELCTSKEVCVSLNGGTYTFFCLPTETGSGRFCVRSCGKEEKVVVKSGILAIIPEAFAYEIGTLFLGEILFKLTSINKPPMTALKVSVENFAFVDYKDGILGGYVKCDTGCNY